MNSVFIDTVAFLALWNRTDQWHNSAKRVYAELLHGRIRLVTTTFVFLECGNAASRLPFRDRVNSLRQTMEDQGQVISPSTDDCAMAWIAYDADSTGGAGIVDHVSFAVMRRLGLTQAFTNDKHFQMAGFETLF